MKTIGEYMKEARKEAGLSQAELEAVSGVSMRSIQCYENGSMYPGILNLTALADALEMSIDDYIGHRIRGGAGHNQNRN